MTKTLNKSNWDGVKLAQNSVHVVCTRSLANYCLTYSPYPYKYYALSKIDQTRIDFSHKFRHMQSILDQELHLQKPRQTLCSQCISSGICEIYDNFHVAVKFSFCTYVVLMNEYTVLQDDQFMENIFYAAKLQFWQFSKIQ